MVEQTILTTENGYQSVERYLQDSGAGHIFLVCDSAMPYLRIDALFKEMAASGRRKVTRFSDFRPNPLYESVTEGIRQFRAAGCDCIVAIGGGSAIDVAKCIKLYAAMDDGKNYLEQPIVPNAIPLLAMPTTTGTGSEATRYAVIYYKGKKQSISHESCIPAAVILDPSALKTLPEYQKKSTMLDALCHAIESFWSVNATPTSRDFSQKALRGILENQDAYLKNEDVGNAAMQQAAYTAGQAIDLTQTTAGHAMCYKLTSLYGIAHGHAAALCVSVLWPYMLEHTQDCIDPRGEAYLQNSFAQLAEQMGCNTPMGAAQQFIEIVKGLNLPRPAYRPGDLETLTATVNPVRLKNNPVHLNQAAIERLYSKIINDE